MTAKNPHKIELSVIIFLRNITKFVSSVYIGNTMADNICNPAEHVLLQNPILHTKSLFFFCYLKSCKHQSLFFELVQKGGREHHCYSKS